MEAKFNQTSSVFLFWASISPNFILTKGHAFTVLACGAISSHLGLKGRSQPLSLLDPHGIPPKTLLPCVSSIQQSPHFPTTTILVQIWPLPQSSLPPVLSYQTGCCSFHLKPACAVMLPKTLLPKDRFSQRPVHLKLSILQYFQIYLTY